MYWFPICILLMWLILALQRVTHVGAYIIIAVPGVILALIPNAIVGSRYDSSFESFSLECHNYTFQTAIEAVGRFGLSDERHNSPVIDFYDIDNGVYTKKCRWVDAIRPIEGLKVVKLSFFTLVPNPDAKAWGWQWYTFLSPSRHYHQLEIPPDKLSEFIPKGHE